MTVSPAIRQNFASALFPVISAGMLLMPLASFAAGQKVERHFAVKGRPVVMIQNVANGRIEVKSWKNPEVVVSASQPSNKIGLDVEQADDRIDVTANILDPSAQEADLSENIQLTVPEETELQIKSQSGLIYVEQVLGDMTLESIAGDIHLKEVSGYIIVRTTGGTLVCTLCGGKLKFDSVSGSAQILQPSLTNVTLYTSFDLNAQTTSGTVDNRVEAFLKPDSHGIRRSAAKYAKGFVGTIGNGLAKV